MKRRQQCGVLIKNACCASSLGGQLSHLAPLQWLLIKEKKKNPRSASAGLLRRLGLRQLYAPPSVQLPVNFPPRSSVNRLFAGFDGLQCFDLRGFVRQYVCVEGLQMLLCSAGGGGQCVIEKASRALPCRDVHLQRRLVCKHVVPARDCQSARSAAAFLTASVSRRSERPERRGCFPPHGAHQIWMHVGRGHFNPLPTRAAC